MPSLIRAFLYLFMAFPAVIVWFLAVGIATFAWASICGHQADLESLALGSLSLAILFTAHVIHLLAGHLLDDPRYRFVPGKIRPRLGWGAALHISGVMAAGAGIGTFIALSDGHWLRAAVALLLFLIFGYTFLRLRREHWRRLQTWTWTRPELPPSPASE